MIELCRKLLKHKRAAIIIGGSAALWGFDIMWDDMVKKAVLMCRTLGILAIDGEHYFRRMELQPHGWHVAKTAANADLMVAMIEETRNALYSVFPHGCYAKAVRPPTDDASLHGLPIAPMVAVPASPPQGGLPASSSGAAEAAYEAAVAAPSATTETSFLAARPDVCTVALSTNELATAF